MTEDFHSYTYFNRIMKKKKKKEISNYTKFRKRKSFVTSLKV